MIDNKKYYSSNYVLGDSRFNYNPFQKYDEQIAKFNEMKNNLIGLYNHVGQTEEMKSKIQDVIDKIDHYIKEFEDLRYNKVKQSKRKH